MLGLTADSTADRMISQLKDVSAHFCLSGTQQKQQVEKSAFTASSTFAQLAQPPIIQQYSRAGNSCLSSNCSSASGLPDEQSTRHAAAAKHIR